MNDDGFRSLRVCVFTRAWQSSGAGLFAQELVNGMLDAPKSPLFRRSSNPLPSKYRARV
jgi:hypothetical protein